MFETSSHWFYDIKNDITRKARISKRKTYKYTVLRDVVKRFIIRRKTLVLLKIRTFLKSLIPIARALFSYIYTYKIIDS